MCFHIHQAEGLQTEYTRRDSQKNIIKLSKGNLAEDMTQVVEYLPSKCKALSSKSNIATKKEKS
jgi:hypothetical protein